MLQGETRYCAICKKQTWHNCTGLCDECNSNAYNARVAAWHDRPLDVKLEEIRKKLENLRAGPTYY